MLDVQRSTFPVFLWILNAVLVIIAAIHAKRREVLPLPITIRFIQ